MTLRTRLFFLLFLVFSLAAWGAGGEAQAHAFDWMAFFGKVFNSTVLFGGLIYVLRKPLIRLLSQQTRGVRVDIEERRRDIETNRADYASLKERLDRLEAEIAEMTRAAREKGEQEKQRIEAEGRREAERIAAVTEEEIRNRVDAALRRLKAQVAEMAIQRFRDEFRERLDPEQHRRIMERNIEMSGETLERK